MGHKIIPIAGNEEIKSVAIRAAKQIEKMKANWCW